MVHRLEHLSTHLGVFDSSYPTPIEVRDRLQLLGLDISAQNDVVQEEGSVIVLRALVLVVDHCRLPCPFVF